MRTTGGPAPEVSTCRDSVAARGTLKLWRPAVSASSATAMSQTISPFRVRTEAGNLWRDPQLASTVQGALEDDLGGCGRGSSGGRWREWSTSGCWAGGDR